MDVWNRIVELLSQKNYSAADLKIILRRWQKILGNNTQIPNEPDRIYKAMTNALRLLKTNEGKNGEAHIPEILRCLLHEKHFSVSELNKVLKEFHLPYQYVLSGETSLQNGVFRQKQENLGREVMQRQYDRLFISHSYEDRNIIEAFVELLEDIGLGSNEIFYSSLPEYGVSLDENIADAIKREFTDKKVYTVFMLSQNYYNSVMCLNEMGAVWVMQHAYSSILLPGYEFKEIRGAIDAGRIGIKLDGERSEVRSRLIEFRDRIQNDFCLQKLDERVWNRKLDKFFSKIDSTK